MDLGERILAPWDFQGGGFSRAFLLATPELLLLMMMDHLKRKFSERCVKYSILKNAIKRFDACSSNVRVEEVGYTSNFGLGKETRTG